MSRRLRSAPRLRFLGVDSLGARLWVVSSGSVLGTYDMPMAPTQIVTDANTGLPVNPTLVLGENDVVFASNPVGSGCTNIVSFSLASGAVNWSYQTSTQSTLSMMAAMSNGGLAINDSQGGIMQLDGSGNVSQVTGTLGGIAQYSWGGNWYVQGSQGASQLVLPLGADQAGIWATPNGNASHTAAAEGLCECIVQTSAAGARTSSTANADTAQTQSRNGPKAMRLVQPASVADCPICNLPPPTPLGQNEAPSCTPPTGGGPTYLLLVGDPGLGIHNVGQNFNITAQTAANDLQSRGNNVVACRVSSVQNVATALTTNGLIGGGVIYYWHGGPYGIVDANNRMIGQVSQLAPGEATGADTNIDFRNVSQLSAVLTAYNGSNIIGTNASILINACSVGVKLYDYYAMFETSIAQQISNKTQRRVYAYTRGMYFSLRDAAHATSSNYGGEPNPLPESLPLYLIPNGQPGHKPSPRPFTPE